MEGTKIASAMLAGKTIAPTIMMSSNCLWKDSWLPTYIANTVKISKTTPLAMLCHGSPDHMHDRMARIGNARMILVRRPRANTAEDRKAINIRHTRQNSAKAILCEPEVPGLPPVAANATSPVRGTNAPSPEMYNMGTINTQPSNKCQIEMYLDLSVAMC
jgi:hypothetical protein